MATTEELFLERLTRQMEMRSAELGIYIDGRLQLLKDDTDVSLRQLETLTPTLRKFKLSLKDRN